MNLRYKTLLKAQKTKNDELWTQYRGLRNWVTEEVRRAKCSYYSDLFDQVKDFKSYWKLIKKATCYNPWTQESWGSSGNIWPRETRHPKWTLFHHWLKACKGTNHLQCRPENVRHYSNNYNHSHGDNTRHHPKSVEETATRHGEWSRWSHTGPRLRKLAGNALVPSLLSVFTSSASSKNRSFNPNVFSLYKSNDETDKLNYRPISLLCVRGKIMGSCIVATVTSHIRENDPSNQSMGVQERPFNWMSANRDDWRLEASTW